MVPVGSKVRLKQKCLKGRGAGRGKQVTMESTIEIEGKDRPACVAETDRDQLRGIKPLQPPELPISCVNLPCRGGHPHVPMISGWVESAFGPTTAGVGMLHCGHGPGDIQGDRGEGCMRQPGVCACRYPTTPPTGPPVARREPQPFELHGRSALTTMPGLRDENWREVMRDPSVLRTDIRTISKPRTPGRAPRWRRRPTPCRPPFSRR